MSGQTFCLFCVFCVILGQFYEEDVFNGSQMLKEFEMEGGTAVSIKDNEVRNIAMPLDVEEDFGLLHNPDLI